MKLIAFDLDATLLDTKKEISARTRVALRAAAAHGNELVPATGRALTAIPACVLALPMLHYAITANGAAVMDLRTRRSLRRAEIPAEEALAVLRFAERYHAMSDCYWQDRGWITRDVLERVGEYNSSQEVISMIRQTRTPVDDLPQFLREHNAAVQKLQLCFSDMEERGRAAEELRAAFPQLLITSSFRNNLELNHADASKGAALRALAGLLSVPMEDTIAFGDSSNDLTMLQEAGIGVAMGNAAPEIQAVCSAVTESNDNDGVAVFLERLLML